MKRDYRLLVPSLGIWVGAFSQSLLFGNIRWVFLTIVLLISIFIRRSLIRIIALSILVGATVLSIHQLALQKDFFEERSGQVARVRALISSDVRQIAGKIRGDFRAENRYFVEVKLLEIDHITLSTPFLLVGNQSLAKLIPGEQVELYGRIRSFDGYSVVAGSIIQVGGIETIHRARWIWRITSAMRRDINRALEPLPADARALIPGLVIGDRSGQDAQLSNAMKRSGLTHLTAVSGANFAIVAALLLLLGRAMRIRGRLLWWGIAITLLAFIFLVRPSSSVLRAAVMTGVLLVAKSQGLRASPIPALATAISLLLLINPFYVRDAGFGLSVFATAGLLLLAPALQEKIEARKVPTLIAEALAIPISATIFCLPLMVLISGQLSLIAILANFLVAPVIAIITGCGVLLMVVAPLHTYLGTLIGWLITPFTLWITFVARGLSALPFAALMWPQSWLGSLAVISIVLLVFWLVRSGKKIALVAISLCLLLEVLISVRPFSNSWIPRDWSFFQCDVGQGDGMIIKTTKGHAIVIDVGPEEGAIDRCLTQLQISQIDLLILTHFHADHVSGLAGALNGREVIEVWISQTLDPPEEVLRVRKLLSATRIVAPKVGTTFYSSNIELRVITAAANSTPNDSSIAVLGKVRGRTFFAAGDLEVDGQFRALSALMHLMPNSIWDRKPIALMKGIHHGSALQDPALPALLRPRVTFFSVGIDNPYGHPSAFALDLYGKYGSVFRTDRDHSLALAERAGNLIVVAQPRSLWAPE